MGDLRTFLKTEKGQKLITFPNNEDGETRQLVGEDLRPTHDTARKIVDDVIVSDLPLMFGPGELGLAALMVANERVSGTTNTDRESASPQIDMMGYIRSIPSRFQESNAKDAMAIDEVASRISTLGQMIRELNDGRYGCGNHGVDMGQLKNINKKLKKCRAWGQSDKKKKKKRKRKDG